MPNRQLSEALIQSLDLAPNVYQRGWDYYQRGAVLDITQRDDTLLAEVEGSDEEPYLVAVRLGDAGIVATDCSCPYSEEWGGVCKHVVAALLTALHRPAQVAQRAPIAELIAELDAEQLRALVRQLVEQTPTIAEVIEALIPRVTARSAPSAPEAAARPASASTTSPVDARAIRRDVRAALHGLDHMRASEAYWYTGAVVGEIETIARQAETYLAAGDGRSALLVLEPLTDAYSEEWFELDDSNGELGGFFDQLGALWTEALLSADLTRAERAHWLDRLGQWQAEAAEYGVGEAFDAPQAAARERWDQPELVRVLRGEADGSQLWAGTPPPFAAVLTEARLRVLERQGRTDEYLNLARATGQTLRYAQMLVRLDRVDQAVEYALHTLTTPDEALDLALALHSRAATAAALRIAEHGLALESPLPVRRLGMAYDPYAEYTATRAGAGTLGLARWLREQALAEGQPELALRAALVAARAASQLEDYQAAQALAGAQWPTLRDELLAELRQQRSFFRLPGLADILLYEQRFDEAIAIADSSQGTHQIVEKVADAVVTARPAWVIETARRNAERIIAEVKSDRYVYAAQWLERARSAARASGREAEWRAYVEQLIAQHKRKSRLVPLLQQLLRG